MSEQKQTIEVPKHRIIDTPPHHQTGDNPHYRQSKIEPYKPKPIQAAPVQVPREGAAANDGDKAAGGFVHAKFLTCLAVLSLLLAALMGCAQTYYTNSITPVTLQVVYTNYGVVVVTGGGNATLNTNYYWNAALGYWTNGANFVGQNAAITNFNGNTSNNGGAGICHPGFGGSSPYVYTNSANAVASSSWVADGATGLGTNPAPTTYFPLVTNAGYYIPAQIVPSTLYSNALP
jgi:hypothetical protein